MNGGRVLLLLVLAVSVLANSGCSFLRPEQVEVESEEPVVYDRLSIDEPLPSEPEASVELILLDHLSDVQQWSPEQFDAQLPILENSYLHAPVTENRLSLAVTLGFGDCDKCDSTRALELFKEELESGSDERSIVFAALCVDLLEARANTIKAKKDLAKERRKVKGLQQKLDALTSIEESLHQRE